MSSADRMWLSELQALLLDTDTLYRFLHQLALLTVNRLPEGRSCGVTVRQDSRPVTLAASDDKTTEVDLLQYELSEGPCLDTLNTGKINYILDTTIEVRWAAFCRAASQLDVRSCLALPLHTPTGQVGCYNLYSAQRDGFPEESRGQLEVFAGNAAGAVAVAVKLADQAQLSEDLHQALTSRAVIDRAIGILMAQQRCDADAAFDLLRRASQRRNIKLRDMAATLITSVSGKPSQVGRFQPRYA